MKNITLVTILVLFCAMGFAQKQSFSKIILLNGKQQFTTEFSIDTLNNELIYRNIKGKDRSYDLDDIFSVTDAEGNEKIFYKPEYADWPSANDVRNFIQGKTDGSNEYKAPLWTAGSFALGIGTPFILGFYAPLIPAGLSTGVGVWPENKFIVENSSPLNSNDFYKEGYKEAVRKRRVNNTLIGGFSGIITAMAIIIIAK